tara:strand:+ start:750 stop:2978 length:2229 start_codon:yes stop_codon:yes gene_type:complete
MMNTVLQRPMFAVPVRRQTGTPEGGETVSSTRTMQGRIDPFKFNLLDKLGVISNKSLGREAPERDFQINIDDAMTNPQLLNDVFNMIISSTGFDMDLFMNMGASQQQDYLNTIRGKLIFGKAEGGEIKSDAVGIADGLDQEEKTVDRDPSKDGIAKVSPEQYVQLMNEVRGDEVSREGRVQELATVVGEKDAQDTPLSVLALVQPVFEAKEQQGIAQTQQAQNMMPMASTQLADPRNMGIVRANTGLIVDAPFNFGNMPLPTTLNIDQPLVSSVPDLTPKRDLVSDFMKEYLGDPVVIDSANVAAEKNLLRDIYGDTKGDVKRALAFSGIDKGLRLAQGEDPLSLLQETSADFFKAIQANNKFERELGLQAYKTLLARKTQMSDREFDIAKMNLENQLKMVFEQSKGMSDPVFLRNPATGTVTVLDEKKDSKKVANLIAGGFEPVSLGTPTVSIVNVAPTNQKDGGLVEATRELKEKEIVKRSKGSPMGGEQLLFAKNELPTYKTYEEIMELGDAERIDPEQKLGQGGMEIIQDKATETKYQNRIIIANELEELITEAIGLMENNPKLAGLVGDMLQFGQKVVLPINQFFDLFGSGSPIPQSVTDYLSDPDIQRLATLEQLIPEKLINFQKDISSNRIPAMNRIVDQRGKLNISGFSDATRAINTLKGILADVRDGANLMREAIARPTINYEDPINLIISEFNVDINDDLVQQALKAIELKPALTQQILESLRKKLEQRSGN